MGCPSVRVSTTALQITAKSVTQPYLRCGCPVRHNSGHRLSTARALNAPNRNRGPDTSSPTAAPPGSAAVTLRSSTGRHHRRSVAAAVLMLHGWAGVTAATGSGWSTDLAWPTDRVIVGGRPPRPRAVDANCRFLRSEGAGRRRREGSAASLDRPGGRGRSFDGRPRRLSPCRRVPRRGDCRRGSWPIRGTGTPMRLSRR